MSLTSKQIDILKWYEGEEYILEKRKVEVKIETKVQAEVEVEVEEKIETMVEVMAFMPKEPDQIKFYKLWDKEFFKINYLKLYAESGIPEWIKEYRSTP